MGSVNKVILVGNLGQDPEIRIMPDGSKIVSFSVATSERWKDKTGEDKSIGIAILIYFLYNRNKSAH